MLEGLGRRASHRCGGSRLRCGPRGTCTLRDAVAVDQRLREAAGASLRYYGTRAHTAREAVRGELLVEAAGGPVVSEIDAMGELLVAELARGPRSAR